MTQQFQRLDPAPAYQLISRTIEREIVLGHIKVGDKLPTESELAQQFGVNRSTVREGIRLLEQEGLVRREGGKRLYVSLPQARDLATRTSRVMVMHEVNFRELWEAAMILEPATAAAASERINSKQLAALEDNIRAMEKELAANKSVVDLDIAFHSTIAEAAGNRAIILAREPISLLFYPSVQVLLKTLAPAGKRLLEAHKKILDGLRRRSQEDAKDWMTKHMVDFKRGYQLAGLDMDRPVEQLPLLA